MMKSHLMLLIRCKIAKKSQKLPKNYKKYRKIKNFIHLQSFSHIMVAGAYFVAICLNLW